MTTKDKILESYLGSLEGTLFKLKRGVISKNMFFDLAYNSFSLYRKILNNLGLDNTNEELYQVRKATKEDEQKYSYVVNGYSFPLNHIFTYYGVEYPEYVDDYGMDTFLLVGNQTISTQCDWDYMLDKILFYDKFVNVYDGDWLLENKLEQSLHDIDLLIKDFMEYEDYYDKKE